ncbi:MAG: GGDEF domain-containing protein [Ruminococcus sp.]|nr:GGDEF domain-containing protein [Ruminococcus sp.]
MKQSTQKKFKTVGILSSSIHKENVNDMVRSVAKAISARGFKTVIFNPFLDMYKSNAFSRGEANIYSLLDSSTVDAVVVLPESIKNEDISMGIIERAKALGLPVLAVERKVEGCISLMFNYADSFEEIIRHVITVHGCRRINFVAGMKNNPFSDERVQRFKKVLSEYGIPFDEKRLGYGDFWDYPTRQLAESWFTSGQPLPEAVICANDVMAMTVCNVLRQHGKRVPQDVIVTGFDGIDLEKYHTPRLTTCAVDIDEAGEACADAIEITLEGGSCENVIEIPYRMRIAQSCGCHWLSGDAIADKIMQLNDAIVIDDTHEDLMFTYLTRGLGCSDKQTLASTMRRYSDTATWCCVNRGSLDDNPHGRLNGFTPEMELLMTTEQDVTEGTLFDRSQLLPNLPDILERHDTVMFCPLHHEDDLIGYIGFAVNLDYALFHNLRRFVLLTDQILESYRNRRTIERANEKLADMHIHDPMTKLLNRRGFYKRASSMIRRMNAGNMSAVVFSVDMDNLKQINDSYGHNEGDRALKALARSLVRLAGPESICSRFGGDEFTVMSLDTDDEFIGQFADKLTSTLDRYASRAKLPYRIEVSVGSICSRFSTADGLDECIRLADERMYAVKKEHKKK